MPNTKQVKVDNWGVFFLQRLKHFFNRTDYCDLTLQFQDFAQLKVHRLVLNACTEYFELLERTCEVYDDCLMMPDDLQVDVMVPIINFMYTGQLEYECRLFDKLYSTAQIMNMSVLTKLLDAQRCELSPQKSTTPIKKEVVLMNTQLAKGMYNSVPSTSTEPKLSRELPRKRLSGRQYGPAPGIIKTEPVKVIPFVKQPPKKPRYEKPGPTRYEVPEELENENLFETSFADISYESQPLMRSFTRDKVEPDERKVKNFYDEASCSRKFEELQASSSSYKRPRGDSSDDNREQVTEYSYPQNLKNEYLNQTQMEEDIFDTNNDNSESLFNQANEACESVPVKQSGKNTTPNLDHAKIISEVLKKYPHLVKSNKNIKLKIMPGYDKSSSSRQPAQSIIFEPKKVKAVNASPKFEFPEADGDWSFVNKNLNQESMARLVSMGVANVTGPWLCLICGTPGKAVNFPTYNKYYRHLADIHLEKISANICEHCGYKSGKRNHLLHHLYTKHGIPPPSQYSFPKCNLCDYIALTKAFLIKHKLTHVDNREFSCNVCNSLFKTRSTLLNHIQMTGHKISPDRKTTNQCVYCNKIFLREANLYTHLKLSHKELSRKDGIIDNSDEEDCNNSKYEDSPYEYSNSPQAEHVSIKQEYDGKIQIISNAPVQRSNIRPSHKLLNTKLLNSDILDKVKFAPNSKYNATPVQQPNIEISSESESLTNVASGIATSLSLSDRIVVFNDNEYVIQSEHEEGGMSMDQPIAEAILPDLPEEYYEHSIQVSMPQQTSTSQIMSQKHVKTPYKAPLPSLKNTAGHQIIVSNAQQPYKTLMSSTPVVFTTNMSTINTAPPLTPKYVQSQIGSVNLGSSSNETIMVLQDGDLNIGQSMANSGSNIVVVYSHPIGSNQKQFVQVSQEQFANQYGGNQIINDDQSHQLNSGSEMMISEHGLVQETIEREEWNESNVEETQDIGKEDVTEEIIDQQDVPVAENESVEIVMEHHTSTGDIHEGSDGQAGEIIISNEEKVYDDEEVDYGEHGEASTEDVAIEKQTDDMSESANIVNSNQIPDSEPMDVSESDAVQDNIASDSVTNNQVVEWSDDELVTKEIQHHETCVIDSTHIKQPEEVELVEESIENIEREVQKHISDKIESHTTDPVIEGAEVCAEEISDAIIVTQEENVEIEEEPIIETEEQIVAEEPMVETEETTIDIAPSTIVEEQQVIEDEIIGEVEEPSTAEESEADHSIVTEDKSEDIELEDDCETNPSVNVKQKSVEKISTLLNDWDDNDSQAETVSEEQEGDEHEIATDATEHKDNEEGAGRNGSAAPVKVANIEKIVSDWDEEEEK